jgi:hypothetical protein
VTLTHTLYTHARTRAAAAEKLSSRRPLFDWSWGSNEGDFFTQKEAQQKKKNQFENPK